MEFLQSIETFLRRFSKFPTLLSLIVTIAVLTGWILDHFVFSNKESPNINPVFKIYNQPMATLPSAVIELSPSIAKEWNLGIGSQVTQAPNNIVLYTIKILESFLLVKLPEDNTFRAFPLDNLPVTIMITSKLGKHIISVEERNSTGYKLKVLDAKL